LRELSPVASIHDLSQEVVCRCGEEVFVGGSWLGGGAQLRSRAGLLSLSQLREGGLMLRRRGQPGWGSPRYGLDSPLGVSSRLC